MLRYYQKALKELEKSSDKHEAMGEKHGAMGEVEKPHREEVVNGQTSVNNRKRKRSDQHESSDTHVTKKDSESKKKKKRKTSKEDWTVTEAETRHDNVDTNEVRKREKKKKTKKRLKSDFNAGNSSGRESFSPQLNESRTDPPVMSNIKEKNRKRERECLTEFSEGTVKIRKHSAKTSKSQKHRDRETPDKIQDSNFSCNGRTENLHASISVESNNLIPATNTCTCASSFEIHVNVSPKSSSQSSVHVYKKSLQSGKDSAKENPKLKARKKKVKDMRSTKASSADNILNSNDNGTEFVKERAEPTLTMDESKLREAVKICNKIHETWTLSKQRLQELAKEGK